MLKIKQYKCQDTFMLALNANTHRVSLMKYKTFYMYHFTDHKWYDLFYDVRGGYVVKQIIALKSS